MRVLLARRFRGTSSSSSPHETGGPSEELSEEEAPVETPLSDQKLPPPSYFLQEASPRKRKAASTATSCSIPPQKRSLSSPSLEDLDQKPKARENLPHSPTSPSTMVSGTRKVDPTTNRTSLFRPLHSNDPACVDESSAANNPLCESNEQVFFLPAGPLENNPSSARGDENVFPKPTAWRSLNPPPPQAATRKRPPGLSSDERIFREALKKDRGLEIREQDGDGNCLFRAIALQVYGDPSMHGDVRRHCMDHMERDQEHFSQFVTGEPFARYVARTRQDGVHGNNPEIQACSELYNRPIEVFTPLHGSDPLNIFHTDYKTGDVPIRLSYHDGNHYNAVIDPLAPTAGLGLGLPGLQPPGYADKLQLDRAMEESIHARDAIELKQAMQTSLMEYQTTASQHPTKGDDDHDDLQRAIKESFLSAEHMSSKNALSLSDMDATYFELEQAALERSLQQCEEGQKQKASTSEDRKAPATTTATEDSSMALPCPSQESIPLAASASAAVAATIPPQPKLRPVEDYPSNVQELVMNGFPLSTVVKAYELVGNNFDNMLSLCLSNNSAENR